MGTSIKSLPTGLRDPVKKRQREFKVRGDGKHQGNKTILKQQDAGTDEITETAQVWTKCDPSSEKETDICPSLFLSQKLSPVDNCQQKKIYFSPVKFPWVYKTTLKGKPQTQL